LIWQIIAKVKWTVRKTVQKVKANLKNQIEVFHKKDIIAINSFIVGKA
jgi:hypothetical protein